MKIKTRTIYETIHDGEAVTIEFIRVGNVPGFSHRVIVNNTHFDWLSSDFKPSAKVARYYFTKLFETKEQPEVL